MDKQFAYSVLTIKALDEAAESRRFTGTATTPTPDRVGDIVEPRGAVFKLPIPLLWQHNSREPIGWVKAAKVTDDGIEVDCEIASIPEPGKLKDRLDEVWQSIKHRLVQGLSIGFKPEESARIGDTYSYRYLKWAWLELSAVTIPANPDGAIAALKGIDPQSAAGREALLHEIKTADMVTRGAAPGARPFVRLEPAPAASGTQPPGATGRRSRVVFL